MIPKKYITVGLEAIRYQKKTKNALRVGKDIVRITKLLSGMNQIMI